jgi:transcriptional regulator with XRE-family HTH domain
VPSVAEVMGANVRALRRGADITLDDFARAVRSYGLPWSTGRAGDFEAGRAAPNLATLYIVAIALSDTVGKTIGRPITLADLFAGKGPVKLNDELPVDLKVLRSALSGDPPRAKPVDKVVRLTPVHTKWAMWADVTPLLHARVFTDFHESDARMCKNIGVEPEAGAAAMAALWKRPFSAERDRRSEPDDNAQRRGQISRQLKADLVGWLNEKGWLDDGDDQ